MPALAVPCSDGKRLQLLRAGRARLTDQKQSGGRSARRPSLLFPAARALRPAARLRRLEEIEARRARSEGRGARRRCKKGCGGGPPVQQRSDSRRRGRARELSRGMGAGRTKTQKDWPRWLCSATGRSRGREKMRPSGEAHGGGRSILHERVAGAPSHYAREIWRRTDGRERIQKQRRGAGGKGRKGGGAQRRGRRRTATFRRADGRKEARDISFYRY
jgi:hypothetical protein